MTGNEIVLSTSRERLEFGDDTVEFVDERAGARLAKYIDQRSVIPESAFLAAGEPAEDGIAFHSVVGEDFAGVGQFVGGGDEPDVFRLVRDFFDIGALSFAPFAFFAGNFVGIRAAIDNARHAVAEFFADFVEARQAALVFDGIVQQRGDDFVFAPAVLNDDSRNA